MNNEKLLENLKKSDVLEIGSLYGLLVEICNDYSRMTDGYSLATGDSKFENLPDEVKKMVKERQEFLSYKNIVKEHMRKTVGDIIKNSLA